MLHHRAPSIDHLRVGDQTYVNASQPGGSNGAVERAVRERQVCYVNGHLGLVDIHDDSLHAARFAVLLGAVRYNMAITAFFRQLIEYNHIRMIGLTVHQQPELVQTVLEAENQFNYGVSSQVTQNA